MDNLSLTQVNPCKFGFHELSLLGGDIPTTLAPSCLSWRSLFTHLVSGPDVDSPPNQLLHSPDVVPAGSLVELPLQRVH